jgi:hypothetical protein
MDRVEAESADVFYFGRLPKQPLVFSEGPPRGETTPADYGRVAVAAHFDLDRPMQEASVATSNSLTGAVIASAANTGRVCLRGLNVSLDTEIGQQFIADCARNTEGLLSDSEVKGKWALSDEDWLRLAANTPLLAAVRAERERRIVNSEAAREAAKRYFAKAPTVLGDILTDNQVSPRHRIEAARELRQVAGDGPDIASAAGEKVVITINLGADQKLVFEKEIARRPPSLSDDGEQP